LILPDPTAIWVRLSHAS